MGIRLGIGSLKIGTPFKSASWSSYWTPQLKAWLTRLVAAGYTADNNYKTIYNNVILAKQASGLLDNWGDIEYFFAAPTEAVSLLNFIKDSHNAEKLSTPTFTPNYGWTGSNNTTTKALNSKYIPSLNKTNITRDNICISFYLYENYNTGVGAYSVYGAKQVAGGVYLSYIPYTGYHYFGLNNAGGTYTTLIPDNSGLISIQRIGSAVKIYRNGLQVYSTTSSSTGEVDRELYILMANTYLKSTACKMGYFAVHRAMTPEEHTAFYNNVIAPYFLFF